MPKRGKSERRDRKKGPKTPTKTPTKKKSNLLRSSRDPRKLLDRRWKNKKKNPSRFTPKGKESVKACKEDIETSSETKPSPRYATPKKPKKKKRVESHSTSNQTTSSEKLSPPLKRVNIDTIDPDDFVEDIDAKEEKMSIPRTRSQKKRTNTETESQVTKKKPRARKASSVARPRFGKKGLEHVDVRVLGDKKSQDAISRLLMEAQSYLTSILEGLRGFAIHNDRERIRSLLSKYRTKQIVLIRPKVKSSANDNVKPDVELQGASGEALRHVVEKVKTRYQLEAQGFELETVSWVFVPPCAPPQSFHQDYEPSLIPSIRDVNVEMGTILHLQAESKSTWCSSAKRENSNDLTF